MEYAELRDLCEPEHEPGERAREGDPEAADEEQLDPRVGPVRLRLRVDGRLEPGQGERSLAHDQQDPEPPEAVERELLLPHVPEGEDERLGHVPEVGPDPHRRSTRPAATCPGPGERSGGTP